MFYQINVLSGIRRVEVVLNVLLYPGVSVWLAYVVSEVLVVCTVMTWKDNVVLVKDPAFSFPLVVVRSSLLFVQVLKFAFTKLYVSFLVVHNLSVLLYHLSWDSLNDRLLLLLS